VAAPDLLDIAGIEPARIPAVPLEQRLAEMLHAYTRSYGRGHPSSRRKDLIDMVLISELADFDAQPLDGAIRKVFARRATHALPASLPAPPTAWARRSRALAEEVGITPTLTGGVSKSRGSSTRCWPARYSALSGSRSRSGDAELCGCRRRPSPKSADATARALLDASARGRDPA